MQEIAKASQFLFFFLLSYYPPFCSKLLTNYQYCCLPSTVVGLFDISGLFLYFFKFWQRVLDFAAGSIHTYVRTYIFTHSLSHARTPVDIFPWGSMFYNVQMLINSVRSARSCLVLGGTLVVR